MIHKAQMIHKYKIKLETESKFLEKVNQTIQSSQKNMNTCFDCWPF